MMTERNTNTKGAQMTAETRADRQIVRSGFFTLIIRKTSFGFAVIQVWENQTETATAFILA